MPISALVLPTSARLPWGQALLTGDPLNTVNPQTLFSATSYALRDFMLAYRDQIVASAAAQVAQAAADAWQAPVARMRIDGSPAGALATGPDLPTIFSTPGVVTHVAPSSVAYAAITADSGLYGRDALLYAVLYALASNLNNNPLTPLAVSPTFLDDTWSAAAAVQSPASVSSGRVLNTSLFLDPDANLAWNDNAIAAQVAALELLFSNPYAVANRLYLLATASAGVRIDPEPYNLISDDGVTRTWAAYPLMPGHLELQYNRNTQLVVWTDEAVGPTPGPVQSAQAFNTPTGDFVQNLYDVPPDQGPLFYQQKAARLVVKAGNDDLIYGTKNPNLFLQGGNTVYQTDSILLTQQGVIQLSLPVLLQSGNNRVSFLVKPDQMFSILGFSAINIYNSTTHTGNPDLAATGTGVTFQSSGNTAGAVWSAPIPVGTTQFTVTFTDSTAQTTAFPVQVYCNGFLIFDGSWAFGQIPGTLVTTQPVQFNSPGQIAQFTVVWTEGLGQLTVESLNFTSVVQSTSYGLSVQIGTNVSQTLTLQAIPGRYDVAQLDILIPATVASPTLNVTWTGGAGFCLYLYAVDVTYFVGASLIENPLEYQLHKIQLLDLALETTQEAYRTILLNTTVPLEFRTEDPIQGWIWDMAANQRWANAIDAQMGGQFIAAFGIAGPSDIGRLVIIPAGLQLGEEGIALANYGANLGTPVLRTLQAWMINFGARVAGPEFGPQSSRAAIAGAPTTHPVVSSDYSFIITGNQNGNPGIFNMTSSVVVNGQPASFVAFTAWTYTNTGAGGGTTSQVVTPTVWLSNLTVNVIYTMTITTTSVNLADISTTVSYTQNFTATGSTQSVQLASLVADVGCTLALDWVSLA